MGFPRPAVRPASFADVRRWPGPSTGLPRRNPAARAQRRRRPGDRHGDRPGAAPLKNCRTRRGRPSPMSRRHRGRHQRHRHHCERAAPAWHRAGLPPPGPTPAPRPDLPLMRRVHPPPPPAPVRRQSGRRPVRGGVPPAGPGQQTQQEPPRHPRSGVIRLKPARRSLRP